MTENIYNITQPSAGRVITLTGLTEELSKDNILGIINKTTGKVLYTPLRPNNISSVSYSSGELTITLAPSVPEVAANDKLFVKVYTNEDRGGELEPATDAEYAVFKSHMATEIDNILTPITEE